MEIKSTNSPTSLKVKTAEIVCGPLEKVALIRLLSNTCQLILSSIKEISIFNKSDIYIPAFIRAYPFLNVEVKDDKEQLNSVIAFDNNSDFVSEDKEFNIFDEDKNLTKEALAKVELVRELNRQRDISKKIIAELKSNDLLIKKELKININSEEKTILSEFYIIDIHKLVQLDDETVASWARKGWMGILDAHLKSIPNFEKILRLNFK